MKRKDEELIRDVIYAYSYKAKRCRKELTKQLSENKRKETKRKRREYYRRKEELLRLFQPVALHYSLYGEKHRYFLYYEVAGSGFHHPLRLFEVTEWGHLSRVRLPDGFVSQIREKEKWNDQELEEKFAYIKGII